MIFAISEAMIKEIGTGFWQTIYMTLVSTLLAYAIGIPIGVILNVSSKEAKKDIRLRNSGKLIAFKISGKTFKITPKTLFYNWLYINALNMHEDLSKQIIEYDAFTDIEFNPNRSINCQAQAAAIFVSLYRKGVLHEALKDIDSFERIVYPKKVDEPIGEQLSFL